MCFCPTNTLALQNNSKLRQGAESRELKERKKKQQGGETRETEEILENEGGRKEEETSGVEVVHMKFLEVT